MKTRKMLATWRVAEMSLFAALFVSACGGGSSGEPDMVGQLEPTTGTIGILFTDAPTDDYSAIKLDVVEAILIGGDDSHTPVFEGVEPIDLLDLTNFSEPVVFGEVPVGNYVKLRLMIDNLELVPLDGGPSIFPSLPANGKIDLLQPDGFDVLPGRTLMMEIDMDANKSIHIVGAGNSGRVNFRPVVKVNIFDGGMPHKLARLEGSVSGTPNAGAGSFVLCDFDSPDMCVDVGTDSTTGIFGDDGLGTEFGTLADGNSVVVIGTYSSDPIVLNAIVVEIGGNAVQVGGNVVNEPMDGEFLLYTNDDTDVLVELQPGTKFYDESGPIDASAIMLGDDVEVEGVMPEVAPEDPTLLRAALVFLEAEDAEQLSGTIGTDPNAGDRTFELMTESSELVCVRVNEDADILLVNTELSEITMAAFTDLLKDQVVELFGVTAEDSCFEAAEVIVDLNASPPPPAP
jgi:hypothetical protein